MPKKSLDISTNLLPLENITKKPELVEQAVDDFDQIKTKSVIKKKKNRQAPVEQLFEDDQVATKNAKQIYKPEDSAGAHTEVEDIEDPVETEIPPAATVVQEDNNQPPKRKKKRRKILKKLERHNNKEDPLEDNQPYRLDQQE